MTTARQWTVYGLIDPRFPRAIRYIGLTIDIRRREKEHRLNSLVGSNNQRLARWKETLRGIGVTLLAIPLEVHRTVQGAQEAERHFIAELGGRKSVNLLNIDAGGAWCPDSQQCPEHGRKIRIANLGRKMSPEAVAKTAAALRGRPKSAAARAKMSAAKKGIRFSPEQRARMGAAHCGFRASAEVRARMSEAQRLWHQQRPMTAATKVKIGEGNRGKVCTPEHRAKISEATRGKKRTPETRARMSEAQRLRYQQKPLSATAKAKLQAGHKAWWAAKRAEERGAE